MAFGEVAQPVQSVPSNSPAGGMSLDALKNLVDPIPASLVQAATSPIAGSHAQMVPSNLSTPVAAHQDRPLNQQQVVGRKASTIKAVGNAVTGATNALGAIVTKQTQIKQNQIKDAATKVIMAQQAIDEAKQAHDAAIANGDAATASKMQAVIQQNQQARDATFSDPKMMKALQKGFDISYTDPASNKTEEHAAVQAAMKDAKTFAEKKAAMQAYQQQQNQQRGAAMGAAFEKSQPQALAPNTQAIQQLGIAQATQKLQAQTQKDWMTFQASVYRSDRTVDAARMRELGSGMLQSQRLAGQQLMQDQRFAQAEKMLGERFNDQTKLVYLHGAEARKVANEIYTDKEADPLTMYTKTRTASDKYQQSAVSAGDTLVALQNARMVQYVDGKGNKIKESEVNQNAVKSIDMQIELVKGAISNYQANAKNFAQQAQRLQSTFGLDERGAENGGDSGTGSNDQSDAAGGTDFTDPLLYNSDGSDSQ